MKIINESHKRLLKEQYEKSVMSYVKALLDMWELDAHYGYFISDEVGGLYCHGESIFINMWEIIFCVENNVSMDKYMDYLEYCMKCKEYNFNVPNLKSYYKGCPTVPQETFDRLDDLKKQLNDSIESVKSNF